MTTATYVYGIVPATIELGDNPSGVEDATVRLVTVDDIAALVSDVHVDKPIGRPEDLQAHARLLDQTASTGPVLPFRFGAVLRDNEAVTEELLQPNRDMLRAALEQMSGNAQYVLKGRYDEAAILREILQESPDAQELRKAIADQPEELTRDARMALGEIITHSLEIKRQRDGEEVVGDLVKTGWSVSPRVVSGENDAFAVAVLAPVDHQTDVERIASELGDKWSGRINIELLGPMAAYDFVVTEQAG